MTPGVERATIPADAQRGETLKLEPYRKWLGVELKLQCKRCGWDEGS